MNDDDLFKKPWSRDSIRRLVAAKDAENERLKQSLNTLAFWIAKRSQEIDQDLRRDEAARARRRWRRRVDPLVQQATHRVAGQ